MLSTRFSAILLYSIYRMAGVKKTRRKRKTSKKILLPGVAVCHPRFKSRKTSQCLTQKQIQKIASSVVVGGLRSSRRELEGALGCRPGDEQCLVRKSWLNAKEKEQIENSSFRPKMPSEWKTNMSTWLSDEDIRKVMKQYEEAYPEFKFLEVAPIDFSAPDPYKKDNKTCVVDSYCNIDLAKLRDEGKRKIGAIFNLDPHYKGGSHWVGLFIDLDAEEVSYFDSYGLPPPGQIARLMRSLTLQDGSLRLQSNGRRFQYKGSECGVYSMVFILSMLTGEKFKTFVKHPISDDKVQSMRRFLYR